MTMFYVAVAAVVVGGAAAVNSGYNANKANQQARSANNTAIVNAKKNAMLADEANGKANARSPDSDAMNSANVVAGKSGQSGTLLTGTSGVDPNSLTLGKTTLLGGGG